MQEEKKSIAIQNPRISSQTIPNGTNTNQSLVGLKLERRQDDEGQERKKSGGNYNCFFYYYSQYLAM